LRRVTFGEPEVGHVPFPTVGERTSAWEIVVPATSQGVTVNVYVDGVYILRSNALAVVLFTETFSTPDEDLHETLARVVAARMKQAVGD
jgi:hypothetical protein